jgi:hypothetical protein
MCDETARAMQFVKKVGMPKDLFMGSMTINRWESYVYIYYDRIGAQLEVCPRDGQC